MEERLKLRLFVANAHAPRSRRAIERVVSAVSGRSVDFAVVDVLDDPETADEHKVIATPTLIRLHPGPSLRVIGDLSGAAADDLLARAVELEGLAG